MHKLYEKWIIRLNIIVIMTKTPEEIAVFNSTSMRFNMKVGCPILSVYSPFSDRVVLPLHTILSPFLPVMDIFSVDPKFCHVLFFV